MGTMVAKTVVDAKGDLIAGTAADTVNRLAVGSNGETLVADSSTSTGLSYQANWAAGKNKIINGDFYINQRGFTSNTTTQTYNFDRWYQAFAGGSQTVTPQTFTSGNAPVSGYEGKNFVQIVTASQSGTSDYSNYAQRIENVRNFAGQTTTVSFWAKAASGTPKLGVSGLQQFGTGGSPSADVIIAGTTVTLSTSWTRYTVPLSVPSISGKTLGTTDNTSILRLDLWTSVGTTLSGAGYPAVGVQNTTIQIWGVQWEAGSVATAFQTATGTIQGELSACQRYYFRTTSPTGSATIGQGACYTTSTMLTTVIHPVPLRVAATSVEYANVQGSDVVNNYASFTNFTINQGSTQNTTLYGIGFTGLVQYRPAEIRTSSSSGYVGLSAEL
jgi:hypothetical protein